MTLCNWFWSMFWNFFVALLINPIPGFHMNLCNEVNICRMFDNCMFSKFFFVVFQTNAARFYCWLGSFNNVVKCQMSHAFMQGHGLQISESDTTKRQTNFGPQRSAIYFQFMIECASSFDFSILIFLKIFHISDSQFRFNCIYCKMWL